MEKNFDSIKEIIQLGTGWVNANVLTIDTLLQLFTVIFLYAVSRYLARPIRLYIDNHPSTNYGERRAKELVKELSIPSVLCVLLWLAYAAAIEMEHASRFLHIVASLLSAWVVISFTAGFVREAAVAKFITVVAWAVAALSILNLLDPTIEILDKMGFQAGDLRISVLAVIKGALILIVLLWAAIAASRYIEKKINRLTQIEPSLRVLFTKFTKITLVVIAIFAGLGTVGIDMSAFAVFGGAIGLGIGFGLQRVVSNLICGVILLLDRSIKPGDVIALQADNTYGKVNRLEARCVSVLTRDGQEHLIPNEDFITQKVENWSYTDRNIRIKIPVGISYDSDPRQAMQILVDAAMAQERVLENPEPVARLVEFADSCVKLELRVWIRDPEQGVINVQSDMLLKIWDEFKAKGIKIPYPQRDLHIVSGSL
jgi:small-conductance mechanosensitive channel